MRSARTRIGKIRMKSGGAVIRVIPPNSFENLKGSVCDFADALNEHADTAGWFVIYRNGASRTGAAYEAGSSDCKMIGGCELLKIDIMNRERMNERR